jgi:hypothetical protein
MIPRTRTRTRSRSRSMSRLYWVGRAREEVARMTVQSHSMCSDSARSTHCSIGECNPLAPHRQAGCIMYASHAPYHQ